MKYPKQLNLPPTFTKDQSWKRKILSIFSNNFGTNYQYIGEENTGILSVFPEKPSSPNFFNVPVRIRLLTNQFDGTQGMIDAKKGFTTSGVEYIYTLIKHSNDSKKNDYIWTLTLRYEDMWSTIHCIITSIESNSEREDAIRNQWTPAEDEEWSFDPFNAFHNDGNLMNQSEKPEHDDQFPTHPLTLSRKALQYIIEHN